MTATVPAALGMPQPVEVPAAAPAHAPGDAPEAWWQGAARHRASHLGLLPWVQPSPSTLGDDPEEPERCHAVVVPTSRDASAGVGSGIRLAAELAARPGSRLLVITSRDADTAASHAAITHAVARTGGGRVDLRIVSLRALEPRLPRVHAVDALTEAARYTVGWEPTAGQSSDVAHKRNAALALARGEGWHRLLFLDDDIKPWGPSRPGRPLSTLDQRGLAYAMRALGPRGHGAVAWAARDYADNSVLCRMRRWLGEHQGVFVGGGALAVSVSARTPFFPAVYNEDWLFLLALVCKQGTRTVARAGAVRQDVPGEPVDATRALREEFGDVLGEGLMNFLGRPELVFVAGRSRAYWQAALARRREMLTDLSARLERTPTLPAAAPRTAARQALTQVLELHAAAPADLPERFCDYVDQWQRGLSSWRDLMFYPQCFRGRALDEAVAEDRRRREGVGAVGV